MTELVQRDGVSARLLQLRKDREMQFVDQRLQKVQAQQDQFRRQRDAERMAMAGQAAQRDAERMTVRRRVGMGLVRLGQRVADDAIGSPTLTG